MKTYKQLKLYVILFITVSALFVSCLADEGNYDYKDINEVEFGGIDPKYTIYRFEDLSITPELNFTIDSNETEGRYNYEWYILANGSSKLISTERNLSAQVTAVPGLHDIFYVVKDTETEIEWQYNFDIEIITSTYEGWLVLNDTNEGPKLDMISEISNTENLVLFDILAGSDLNLEGDAGFVNTYTPNFRQYAVYVSSSITGTTRVDADTWEWTPGLHLRTEFLSEQPDNMEATAIHQLQAGSGQAFCIVDNNIYYTDPTSRILYNNPVNKTEVGVTFEASNYVATNGKVIYDNTNKKFQYLSGSAPNYNSYDMPAPLPWDKKFEWDNGDDLLYMETNDFNGNNASNFAIVKTPDAKYFVYTFRSTTQTGAYDLTNAPEIDQASLFAVSPAYGYIFYAVGGKVYQYNIFDNVNDLVIDKGAEEITLLKFNNFENDRFVPKYKTYQNMLIVGAYDGSEGALEFYDVPSANNDITLNARYEGFGKIKSVDYRERF
ncbi:PKD-like family lipoprotein [Gaetbulibacter saemankumensis]|uniref:PKD-like family lipoprotein n=1 Tax=Gaetbulibacter saemankumensis TaxID=311208 RepID=UPI0004873B8E|nr:PKD-like family lipoprotein [Gaetbulibacter saemankumensis]